MQKLKMVGEALATELTQAQIDQISGGECENPYMTEWKCWLNEAGNWECEGVVDCLDDI